ncbi:MAG TPA: hypothetical protein PKC72_00540 [Chitinophagaceae bacterium]|nr:hypothetical protein [Chitinophagaceae bacterium]
MRGRYITRNIEMVCLANHSRRKRDSSNNPSLSTDTVNNSLGKIPGDGDYEKGHNSTKSNGTWLVFGKTNAA